jgi:transposase InsO family protein
MRSAVRCEAYRKLLANHGLIGSMGRRGNPHDNAKAESFMKTLKVEAVYLMDYETFEDATADLPHFQKLRERIPSCRALSASLLAPVRVSSYDPACPRKAVALTMPARRLTNGVTTVATWQDNTYTGLHRGGAPSDSV